MKNILLISGLTLFGIQTISHAEPHAQTVRDQVWCTSISGYGSTGDKIRTFTSSNCYTSGTAIRYTSDTTNGDTFTINEDGIYAITYSDQFSQAAGMGISRNCSPTQLTTPIDSVSSQNTVVVTQTAATDDGGSVSVTLSLFPGDVIRAHGNGQPSGTVTFAQNFRIMKISN